MLTLPGRLLARGSWLGAARRRSDAGAALCWNAPAPAPRKRNSLAAQRGKTDCAGSLLLAPLSLPLRPRSQACVSQGNSPAKRRVEEPRLRDAGAMVALRSLCSPKPPPGGCLAPSCAHRSSSLTFPCWRPGLKGAVVPLVAGGQAGSVCLSRPGCQQPKGQRSSPGPSPVPQWRLARTPVRSHRLLRPPTLPCGPFYPKKGASQRALLPQRQEERQDVADPWRFPGCKTPARNRAHQLEMAAVASPGGYRSWGGKEEESGGFPSPRTPRFINYPIAKDGNS